MANSMVPGNCCFACNLAGRLAEPDATQPAGSDYDIEPNVPREIATGLPKNDFFIRFEIITGGIWDITLELVDQATDTVIDSAEFASGRTTPIATFYPALLLTGSTAEHHATIASQTESTSSELLVRSTRNFAGRLDRTNRSLSFDHDRPHGHAFTPTAGPDITFYPPDSAITVETDDRENEGPIKLVVKSTTGVTIRIAELSRSNRLFDIDTGSADCFVEPSSVNQTCPIAQVTCGSTFTSRHLDASFGANGTFGHPGYWYGGVDRPVESRCSASYGASGGQVFATISSFRTGAGLETQGNVAWGIGSGTPFAGATFFAGSASFGTTTIRIEETLATVYPLIGGVQVNRDSIDASLRVMLLGGRWVPSVLSGALQSTDPADGSGGYEIANGDGSSWIYDRVRPSNTGVPGNVGVTFSVGTFFYDLTFSKPHSGCLSRPSELGTQSFAISEATNYTDYLDFIDQQIANPPISTGVGFYGTGRNDFVTVEGLEWRPADDPPAGAIPANAPEFYVGQKVRRVAIPFDQSMTVTFGDG
ncbi:MAG: hypothetical protein AAFX06_29320 [Planctomycetota bacterium]